VTILGAMPAEIRDAQALLQNRRQNEFLGRPFYEGTALGHAALVGVCGIGKTISAMVTQHVIDRWYPDILIVAGIAGAIRDGLDVLDTFVARDCVQHDMDATRLGVARGEIPYTSIRIVGCDPHLVDLARHAPPLEVRRHVGRALTGDQLITSEELCTRRYLVNELGGDVVDMESASVGTVCLTSGVPFLVIRTISDRVQADVRGDMKDVLGVASRNACALIEHVVRHV